MSWLTLVLGLGLARADLYINELSSFFTRATPTSTPYSDSHTLSAKYQYSELVQQPVYLLFRKEKLCYIPPKVRSVSDRLL